MYRCTAWKVSKYRVISGPYSPIFSPNTEKYGLEITPYLDTSRSDEPTLTHLCSMFPFFFFSEKRMKQWNVSFAPINSFVPNITFLYTLKTINENYSNWLNFLLLLLLKLKKLRFFAFLRLKKTSLRLHNYYGHSFLQEKKPYFITQCNPILANFCPMLLIHTT